MTANLLAVCGWTLLRSAVVAAMVVPLARTLASTLDGGSRPFRSAVGMALVLLCAVPDLAVGYAWADAGLRIGTSPIVSEILYLALLTGKLLPLATVLCLAVPREPLSATAVHCLRLAGITAWQRAFILARANARTVAPIASVVFLLAFQDFELAARLGVRAWPVRLFDLHAREGLPLGDSVRLTLVPVLIELLVIIPALVLAVPRSAAARPAADRRVRSPRRAVIGLLLMTLVVGVCLVPAAIVLRDTVLGGQVLLREPVYREQLPREIAQGTFVAGLAAMGSLLLGSLIAEQWRTRPWLSALVIPGLLGGLVLSLAGRFAVQAFDNAWTSATGQPGLYRTPVPLIVVQMLWLLPRATLIAALLGTLTRTTAIHLGALLAASADSRQCRTGTDLLWHGRRKAAFWSLILLAWWGYWDLTTFALLAPTGFVSAPVRLYNFMHFRQNTVLSAMLFAAIALPALVVLVCYPIVRRWRTGWD